VQGEAVIMIYINVWDTGIGCEFYEVTIGNTDDSDPSNADYLDSHMVLKQTTDIIRANAFAQQLYNTITEGKGTAIAVLHTL
jgi:hypothetical protein